MPLAMLRRERSIGLNQSGEGLPKACIGADAMDANMAASSKSTIRGNSENRARYCKTLTALDRHAMMRWRNGEGDDLIHAQRCRYLDIAAFQRLGAVSGPMSTPR